MDKILHQPLGGNEMPRFGGIATMMPITQWFASPVRMDANSKPQPYLTERWDLRVLTSYRILPDEISASPLINDNKVITVFVGGVYHF